MRTGLSSLYDDINLALAMMQPRITRFRSAKAIKSRRSKQYRMIGGKGRVWTDILDCSLVSISGTASFQVLRPVHV